MEQGPPIRSLTENAECFRIEQASTHAVQASRLYVESAEDTKREVRLCSLQPGPGKNHAEPV
jgi:hypothetical protein